MGQVCTIRRPGREPPAPPPAPIPVTGNVCLTTPERAGMSEVCRIAQEIGRLNGIGSVPAFKLHGVQCARPEERVLGLRDHVAEMRAALDRLEIAHEAANERRGA